MITERSIVSMETSRQYHNRFMHCQSHYYTLYMYIQVYMYTCMYMYTCIRCTRTHDCWSVWSAQCEAVCGENREGGWTKGEKERGQYYTIQLKYIYTCPLTCSLLPGPSSGTTALNSVFNSVPAGIMPSSSKLLTSASLPWAT